VVAGTVADTMYLSSELTVFYRTSADGQTIETFDLGPGRIRSMYNDHGTIFATQALNFVEIENAVSGTPVINQIAPLSNLYGSLTKINDLFYGTTDNGQSLYSIDVSNPLNPVETFIGSNGLGGTGGLAYAPELDKLFAISKHTDALYEMDPTNGQVSFIGSLGIDDLSGGAEWFDGQLFLAVGNGTSGDYEIGTVNVLTGEYSTVVAVQPGGGEEVAIGLAIVPEPATAVLCLLLGGWVLRRR